MRTCGAPPLTVVALQSALAAPRQQRPVCLRPVGARGSSAALAWQSSRSGALPTLRGSRPLPARSLDEGAQCSEGGAGRDDLVHAPALEHVRDEACVAAWSGLGLGLGLVLGWGSGSGSGSGQGGSRPARASSARRSRRSCLRACWRARRLLRARARATARVRARVRFRGGIGFGFGPEGSG